MRRFSNVNTKYSMPMVLTFRVLRWLLVHCADDWPKNGCWNPVSKGSALSTYRRQRIISILSRSRWTCQIILPVYIFRVLQGIWLAGTKKFSMVRQGVPMRRLRKSKTSGCFNGSSPVVVHIGNVFSHLNEFLLILFSRDG